MNYELNGEKKELNFVDKIEDINYRSDVVDIIANNYVNDGCPPLLKENIFALGYFALMTDIQIEDDNVMYSIIKQISKENLLYYNELFDAYIDRIQFLISENGLKAKIYKTLSKLDVLIQNYTDPKNASGLLKGVVKEFGKLDKEHLELVMPYLQSSLSILDMKSNKEK